MVNLFIKDRCSSSPIHSISEIVDDAANLSSALLDENVDIFQIKDKFTNDAWDKVVDLYRRRKDMPWICPACHMQIAEFPSVGCDSCLEWIHISCANLKKIPKTRFWYCGACKLQVVYYKLQYVHIELGLQKYDQSNSRPTNCLISKSMNHERMEHQFEDCTHQL